MGSRVDEFIQNPRKALLVLATPIAIAMFVQTMYNIVDTAWVGRLGARAIAALTFAFPIFFILIGLTSGMGTGINSVIARQLGAGDKEAAENAAAHGLIMSEVFAALVFLLSLFSLRPLFSLFGATTEVLGLSLDYMFIILLGVFVMFPAYALNSIFSAQGDTRTPMKVQIAALILNAVLDPVFIYVLGYGIAGAAIATVVAFAFSLGLYFFYLGSRSYLKLRLRRFRFCFPLCREICRVGAPAALTMLTMSIYVMFLNRFMAHFGTDYVASFGLATRLESFAAMPIVALSVSLVTLVGMFLGARKIDIMKQVSWYGLKIGVAFTSILGIIFFIFPSLFLRIFTPQAALLMIGSAYIRIDVLTFPLMTVSTVVSRILQGMGFGVPGLIINFIRIFIVAVPLAYVFVFVLGYGFLSIAWAMVLGGVASNLTAFMWLTAKFRGLG
jgi:putative MATE family efflux protein